MIQESQHQPIIANLLKDYTFNPLVFKELGEPLIYHEGIRFLFWIENSEVLSFIGYTEKFPKCRLRYAYTHPDHRNKGFFSKLIDEMEEFTTCGTVEATATKSALSHYLKRGYVITKEFKHYAKIKKSL